MASVEITPAEAAIQVGQQQVFVPIAYDVSNHAIRTATFIFTSSNSRVATVDANGIATGASAGTVTITARTGTGTAARRATATLTVSAATQPVQQAVTVPPQVRPSAPGGPPAAAAAAVGYLSVSTRPASTIFVDGRPVGTNLLRFEVLAGTHRLTFEVRDSTGTWRAQALDVVVGPYETKVLRDLVLVRR